MPPGRPPKPIEQKRLLGNPGKRTLPAPGKLLILEPARLDDAPDSLGDAGRRLWQFALTETPWIGRSDMPTLEMFCTLADLKAKLEVVGDVDRLLKVIDQMRRVATELGMSPSARSRLGLAEVKAQSKLEELRARRERHAAG